MVLRIHKMSCMCLFSVYLLMLNKFCPSPCTCTQGISETNIGNQENDCIPFDPCLCPTFRLVTAITPLVVSVHRTAVLFVYRYPGLWPAMMGLWSGISVWVNHILSYRKLMPKWNLFRFMIYIDQSSREISSRNIIHFNAFVNVSMSYFYSVDTIWWILCL